jgi:hypothetical protein
MAKFSGLTDNLANRRQEHGNPLDWRTFGPFASQAQAIAWETRMHARGHEGSFHDSGWRYGYTYTITDATIE